MSSIKNLIKLANLFEVKIKKFSSVKSIDEALEVLGLSSLKDRHALRAAYRDKSQINHPDKGGKVEDMVRINSAYKLLSDALDRGISHSVSDTGEHRYETIEERERRLKKEELEREVEEIRKRRAEYLSKDKDKSEEKDSPKRNEPKEPSTPTHRKPINFNTDLFRPVNFDKPSIKLEPEKSEKSEKNKVMPWLFQPIKNR